MKQSIWSFSKLTLLELFVAVILVYTFGGWGCQQVEPEKEMKTWVGKWTFVEFADSTGVKSPGIGVYHYYDNGTFASQIITSTERPNLTANPSTPEDYKAAFDGYRAGFGAYSVNEEEGSLTYEYTSNLRPHRVVGEPTKVYFEVKDDIMTLNYKESGFILTLRRESENTSNK